MEERGRERRIQGGWLKRRGEREEEKEVEWKRRGERETKSRRLVEERMRERLREGV